MSIRRDGGGGCTARRLRQVAGMGLLVIVAAVSAACSAKKPAPAEAAREPDDPCVAAGNGERLRGLFDSRQRQTADGADYVLAAGDLMAVTIYNYRPEGGDFASDVRVDDRGYVSLPMTDPIKAGGKNLTQVRRQIVEGLRRAEVMREPLVGVFLKEYQGQEVIVLGAVGKPGLYHLSRGRQTLADVLSMAGGLSQTAGNYVLLRPGDAEAHEGQAAGSEAVEGSLPGPDLQALARQPGMIAVCPETAGQGNPETLALSIRGGDMVVVPEAGQAYAEGEVDKPGLYPLARGMTLTQLITAAGGLRFPADRKHVKLIRSAGKGKGTEWEIDLDEIEAGARPDVPLERNDRVIIGATAGRKVAYGFYYTLTSIVRVTLGGAATLF